MINVHRNVMYFCSVREFSFGESEMVQARLVGCCFCSARRAVDLTWMALRNK